MSWPRRQLMQHSLTAMLFAVVAPHLSAAYSIHGQLTDEVQNGVSIARTSATDYDEQGNALVSSYTANALNQYTQRTVPGYAAIRGEAATNATVTVNERPTFRQGAFFYGGDVADNTDSSV